MATDLEQIREEISWADTERIPILEKEINSFIESKPYRLFTEPDGETGRHVIKMQSVRCVPLAIRMLAREAVHTLRTSLDHLAVLLALRNGSAITKDVYFPIASDKQTYRKARTKIRRLSKKDQEILDGIMPYKKGNNALWALHNIDIANKHRQIDMLPIKQNGMGFCEGKFYLPSFNCGGVIDKGISIIAFDPAFPVRAKFSVSIVFSSEGERASVPVISGLREFSEVCKGVVKLFE